MKIKKELVLKTKYKVTTADCDMFGRARMGAVLNYLIQAAVDSANDLGFGFSDLEREDLFWVLSKISIEIERPLLWDEEIVVETWPKDIERLLYLRDFLIKDKNGNIIGRAVSAWMSLDKVRRRPKLISNDKSNYFTELKEKHAINKLPNTINKIDSDLYYNVRSYYYDLDINSHVTSTRYVDWVMNYFSVDFHKHNFPKAFTINYNKEIMVNQNIKILIQENENKQFVFEGNNTDLRLNAYRVELKF